MIEKILFILTIVILPLSSVHSQTNMDSTIVTDSVFIICGEIAADSIIEGQRIGFGGFYSEQWKRYQKLLSASSDSVLFELTNHSSPTVRGYAYWGLIERNTDLLMAAIRTHKSDTALVSSLQGCIGTTSRVIDLATEGAYYQYVHDDKKGLKEEDKLYIEKAHKNIMDRYREMMRNRRKK